MVTTKYLAKFQSPRAITRPKIIGPERNVNLICNLSLYTHIPNIKSISQSIVQLFYFGITDMGNTMSPPLSGGDIKTKQNKTNKTQKYPRTNLVEIFNQIDWVFKPCIYHLTYTQII